MPDPIKKSTTYDPSTGETTFRASWSGSSNSFSRGPVTPKPTQRTVAARQVSSPASKVAASRSNSEGQRIAVAFKSPTAAPAKGMDLKSDVDIKEKAPQSIRKEKIEIKTKLEKEQFNKNVMESYPGKTLEQATEKYYKEKDRRERKGAREVERDRVSNLAGPNKRGSGGCTRC